MERRYQIFVSSTFEDLKEERQAVLRAILELDHMPAGMELFPAADNEAWQLIRDVIDASDCYVVIVGGRYGSLDEEGLGYTEKEYDYALAAGKPVIALLHSDPESLARGKTTPTTRRGRSSRDSARRSRRGTPAASGRTSANSSRASSAASSPPSSAVRGRAGSAQKMCRQTRPSRRY